MPHRDPRWRLTMEVPNGAASLDLLATTVPEAVAEVGRRAALLWSILPPSVRAGTTWVVAPSRDATAATDATSSPTPTSTSAEQASEAIVR